MKVEKLNEIEKSTEARFDALPLYEFPKQLTMAEVNFLLLIRMIKRMEAIELKLLGVLEGFEFADNSDEGSAPQTDEDGQAPAPKKRGRKAKKK